MGEVLIPPWVLPVTPETLQRVDDASVEFPPAFGRGMTQRGSWADPRWGLKRRYQALRNEELAAISAALNDARGKFNKVLATIHTPRRGTFPNAEACTNGTFANGVTGWTGAGGATPVLTVADRVGRITQTVGVTASNSCRVEQTVSNLVQYAVYVSRMFANAGTPGITQFAAYVGSGSALHDYQDSGTFGLTSAGMNTMAVVPMATSATLAAVGLTASGNMPGEFFEVPYISLNRGALVDNAVNLLTWSDDFTDASWSKTRCSASGNLNTAPDGTSLADRIIEDSTASNSHGVTKAVTVAATTGIDYTFSVAVLQGTRGWCFIGMTENTSSHDARVWLNLTTGALGTIQTTGANWSNLRATVTDIGGGGSWYRLSITARKNSASTTVIPFVFISNGDAVVNYSGNGSSYIVAWRATFAQGNAPARLVGTTSSAQGPSSAASFQTNAASLYLKGLPVSTNGLLEVGDWVEIMGELKQCVSRLNSDSGGLGYLQFRPALSATPFYEAPVVINEPFGRFLLPGGTVDFENQYGLYGEAELDLLEVYA